MKKNKNLYSKEAYLALLLDEVATAANMAMSSELMDDLELEVDLKEISDKYAKLASKLEKKVGKKKMAFAEAGAAAETLLYARDRLSYRNGAPRKHLPKDFVTRLLSLGSRMLEFRNKLCLPM